MGVYRVKSLTFHQYIILLQVFVMRQINRPLQEVLWRMYDAYFPSSALICMVRVAGTIKTIQFSDLFLCNISDSMDSDYL
jgi:hypothetical protein